ncbi:MAG: hypothetical protein CMC05_02685 [Flavobacteriaceae bacterium]|nr:hypothetical protein [Flavobacteriaceae bacterium]|tara:strand:+ start:5451 stop:5864 length:414 start_codon:yes stop_codon:yes gene_type:complete
MHFENSDFSKTLNYKKVVLNFCVYYLLDDFFIMEVNEGEHFNWDKLNTLLDSLRDYYGNHKTLAYIANRVNSYSIDPVLWSYFDKDDSLLIAASIVSYRDSSFMNANIEKQMASIPLKRAHSLGEAINWVRQLKEFN